MRWYELMEGRSDDLFNRYGGKVMKFAQLPASAQKSLEHNSSFDGWDIDTENSLFGYVILPIEVLQHACLTAPDNEFPEEWDWDEYHADYWQSENEAHYANHLNEMWPVILDDGEGILDGWHRLHWYSRNGVKQVPAILFVNQDELTEGHKKRRKRRRKHAPIGIGYGYYYGWPGSGNDSGQGPCDGGGDGGGGGGE